MHKNYKSQKIVYISKNSFEQSSIPSESYKLTYYSDVLYDIESTSGMKFSAKMRPTKSPRLEIIRYKVNDNIELCYYFNNDGSIRSAFFEKLPDPIIHPQLAKTIVGEYNRYTPNSSINHNNIDYRTFWDNGTNITDNIQRITGFTDEQFKSHEFDSSERFQLNVTFNDFYIVSDYSETIIDINNVINKIQKH